MPRCPNCSYELSLLQQRSRYKCAKCSCLFSQIKIDNKEFREWNKRQRQADIENIMPKKRPRLSEEERKAKPLPKKRIKLTKEDHLAREKERYRKNREKEIERCRIYRENNKEKRRLYNQLWREKNEERYNQWLQSYLEQNRENDKLKKRLGYWRTKQSNLAIGSLMCSPEILEGIPIPLFIE